MDFRNETNTSFGSGDKFFRGFKWTMTHEKQATTNVLHQKNMSVLYIKALKGYICH